ncbi:FAD-dependent monooxygenase [Desulfobulbus sp. AH-315-M07]|nr:FAD-dependent monooxygenase [Desulfobulbus sp. AH-315-M07]
MAESYYDVAIIGAGPVGCVTALAFSKLRRARVLLLEANPRACQRLAGEWLHPPAVEIMRELGVEVPVHHDTGRGFAVFPDDGSETMVLPYSSGRGVSVEHSCLVELLRARVKARVADGDIEYVQGRALSIAGQKLTYQTGSEERSATAALIVGAAGRSVHKLLGTTEQNTASYSRMAGVLLECPLPDREMPHEGYGHIFLGGPGPVLAYRLSRRHVRMCLDVPSKLRMGRNREAVLWDAFAPVLPETLRRPFLVALQQGELSWATNQIRPRADFGRDGLALVGDAAGHHHPLTAVGMTLGFQDAIALARAKSWNAYRKERMRKSRVPEMLAVALYEVFADTSDEVMAIRQAVYAMWRRYPGERRRTMAFLAAQDAHPLRFGSSFVRAVGLAASGLAKNGVASGQWSHVAKVSRELTDRVRWLLAGALRLTAAKPFTETRSADEEYGGALRATGATAEVFEHPATTRQAARRALAQAEPSIALERAIRALKRQQRPDGSWEGECVWCPMLVAQYVLMCHLTDTPIDEQRRVRILTNFAFTRLSSGTWGLHDLSEPYLFTTALVYVAARILGVDKDSPLLARAGAFIAAEGGVEAIPSWGKFWLALVGLYEWEGVNPVLPEVWQLPKWMPLHPSNYYCHTRLIYLGMASLYGERFAIRDESLNDQLRAELFPMGYSNVDFKAARKKLRADEIHTQPSAALKIAYDALMVLDRSHTPGRRRAIRAKLREHIRFELSSSDYTCISPVSGLLNILALWRHDPDDDDLRRALARFDGWMWEDDVAGTRVAGARSASWDTSFAVQALIAASPHFDVTSSLERADAFLETQQIRKPAVDRDYRDFYRIDPVGGYCFAGVWHGWPVSDCTAEAMCARIESPVGSATEEQMTLAARFVLRCQNSDGGFGSYESGGEVPLEWLNPAEMFGDSMTEHSYGECTASCTAALATFRKRYPGVLDDEIDTAVARAERCVRSAQRPDGAWSGAWGIHFTYGTMFGVRGLMASGAPVQDPAIRKGCRWLKAHQRPDGGWGEHHTSCLTDRYTEEDHSQVVQTAWALTTLLEACDPDWDAIERAAHFLVSVQPENGKWAQPEPCGVFFHTALIDYPLYKQYFPIWALGLYETRRLARLKLLPASPPVAARVSM